MSPVSVHVHSLAGFLCEVEAEEEWKLRQLKAVVEAKAGIPVFEQRLICGCRELVNDGTKLRKILQDASEIAEADTSDGSAGSPCSSPAKEKPLELALVRRDGFQADWLAKVDQQPCVLAFAPPEVCADRDIIMAAVQRSGPAIEYASEELQADPEVALAAVKQNVLALEYIAEELTSDNIIALAALRQQKQTNYVLGYIDESLWEDVDFVVAAAEFCDKPLERASMAIRGDRDAVLRIVQVRGLALKTIARDFCGDREIVLAAVASNGLALQFACLDLREDREVVLTACRQNGMALRNAAEDLRKDREVVLTAVKQCPSARMCAAKALHMDPEVLRVALCHKPK